MLHFKKPSLRTFATLLSAGALLLSALPALAALDTATLEKNVLQRFNTTRPANYPELLPADIKVIDSQPINVRGFPLYAARLQMQLRVEGQPEPVIKTITIAVNEGGTVQFDNIGDVATAVDLIAPQAKKLMTLTLPEKKNMTAGIIGTGKRTLTMISDPYCTYCRDAFKWAQKNPDKYSAFFIEGLPLPGNLGSEGVVWLLNSLNASSPEEYRMVLEYAYTELPSVLLPEGTNLMDASVRAAGREAVMKNIMERFPDIAPEKDAKTLLARLEKDEKAKQVAATTALTDQGISSTPIFRVDDIPLRGFHAPTLEVMLKEEKERTTFFQGK